MLDSLFETPTQVFSCEYCKIFKYTFFYRAPSVAAFVLSNTVGGEMVFVLLWRRSMKYLKSLNMLTDQKLPSNNDYVLLIWP